MDKARKARGIKNWEIPIWHKDCPDPKKEIALLQNVCLFVLSVNEAYTFKIEYIEEGYLCVNGFKKGKKIVEMHVVDADKGKIGLFF